MSTCCLCQQTDPEPLPVVPIMEEVELEGLAFIVESFVMPTSNDETLYLCDFCAIRVKRLANKEVELDTNV